MERTKRTKYRKSSIALLFVLALLGCFAQGCKPRIITVDRVRTETNERVQVDSVYMSDTLYIERISHDTPCPDTVRIERVRFVEKKKNQTEAKGLVDTLRVDGQDIRHVARQKSELERTREQKAEATQKLTNTRWRLGVSLVLNLILVGVIYFFSVRMLRR
ncbi:MAG: hypothetical protein SPI35_05810 [Porphyromonas sp.]|nr:hypothetical protein [Porphyromonas sp.]